MSKRKKRSVCHLAAQNFFTIIFSCEKEMAILTTDL